jgi:hypothetical protein
VLHVDRASARPKVRADGECRSPTPPRQSRHPPSGRQAGLDLAQWPATAVIIRSAAQSTLSYARRLHPPTEDGRLKRDSRNLGPQLRRQERYPESATATERTAL